MLKKVIKPGSKITIMIGVILAMLLSALDQTIVATAMPNVVRELNGLEHLSWVFTAYMLASTVIIPIYGKLSDMFGRRGLYLLGIFVFLLGSVLSGMSHSMTQLIIFRAIQGLGGGMMMVNSIAIIGDIFPPAERAKWQGVLGGIFGLAAVAGPFLGGWLTDNWGWRSIFYINLPLGLLAIIILATALPKIIPDIKQRSIDFAGAVTLTLGLVPLLLGLVWGGNQYAWGSGEILGLLAGAVVMLTAFIFIERKAKEPILSLDLFKNRVFLVSVLVTFLTAMGMFGAILYIPLFSQGVIGVSATNSGVVLLPMMVGLVLASIVSGQIISRTGKYKWLAIIGMAITVIGMYLFSTMTAGTTNPELIRNMAITGIGLGVTMPIFTIVIQSAFDHSRLGEVTAASQLFRSIGGTVGTAVLGSVLNSQLTKQFASIGQEPFLQTLQQTGIKLPFTSFNANALQGLLVPDGQKAIVDMLSKAPAALQAQLMTSFDHFLTAIKIGFSNSISQVFLVGAILMFAAFIIVFFLPVITLRKTQKSAFVEAGQELEAELGQSDSENEPDLG